MSESVRLLQITRNKTLNVEFLKLYCFRLDARISNGKPVTASSSGLGIYGQVGSVKE